MKINEIISACLKFLRIKENIMPEGQYYMAI